MNISRKCKSSSDLSRIAVVVLCVLQLSTLVGCAALGMRRPVNDDDLAAIAKVGVASELTDDFHLIHIGLTIFNNKYSKESVPEWQIDEYTKSVLATELGKSDRYGVGTIRGSFSNEEDRYKINYAALAAAAGDQGFDTVVVARPTRYDNARFHEGGYGFFERTGLGLEERCAYSLFVLEVIDVASQRQLAWEWGFPCYEGDEDIAWKESLGEYSDEERSDIESRVKREIAESVRTALVTLRLLDAEP